MNVHFQDVVLCTNEFTPLEELIRILNPHFMDLDLFQNQRFLVIFEVESDSLVFQVVIRILESLDLLKLQFLLIICQLIACVFPSCLKSLTFLFESKVHH